MENEVSIGSLQRETETLGDNKGEWRQNDDADSAKPHDLID